MGAVFVDHLLVLHLTKHKIDSAPDTLVRKHTYTHSKQKTWFIAFSHEVIYIMCD